MARSKKATGVELAASLFTLTCGITNVHRVGNNQFNQFEG